MHTERNASGSGRINGYILEHQRAQYRANHKNQPVNAYAFDKIDLSNSIPDKSGEYGWLIKLVTDMPDDEVERKMKGFKKSFNDIDDGIIEKVIMEVL